MSRNYARFYVLLNRLPTADRDELKATLVSQYTVHLDKETLDGAVEYGGSEGARGDFRRCR